MTAAARVKQIIAAQLDVPVERVADHASIETLGGDGLDLYETIARVEEQFGISISDEQFEQTTTVADLVAVVEAA